MYDEGMELAYQPMQPEKHSGLGIISFIISLLSMLTALCFCAAAYWVGNQPPSYSSEPDPLSLAAAVLCCGGMLANVAGVVLGIIGVAQKDVKKIFAILGLIFNAVILLGWLAITLIGVLGAAVLLRGM